MQKKRLLLLFGSLLLAMVLVMLPLMSACGPEEEEVVGPAVEEEEEEEEEEGVGPVVEAKKEYTIVTQSIYGPQVGSGSTVLLFDMWEEATEGRVTIEAHWNCALYSPQEMVGAVSRGDLHYISVGSYQTNAYDTRWNVFDLPLLIPGHEMNFAVVANPLYEELWKDTGTKLGFHWLQFMDTYVHRHHNPEFYLPYGYSSAGYGFYTDRPINTMEDLAGLRIRTMTSPPQVAMGAALGFNALAITFGEASMALSTGMLDGVVTCPDLGWLIPLGVFDYLESCLWWPAVMAGPFSNIGNTEFWNSIDPETMEILVNTAQEWIEVTATELGIPDDIACCEAQRANLEVTELTDAEYQRWLEAVRYIWDDWMAKTEGGAELVEKIEEVRPTVGKY